MPLAVTAAAENSDRTVRRCRRQSRACRRSRRSVVAKIEEDGGQTSTQQVHASCFTRLKTAEQRLDKLEPLSQSVSGRPHLTLRRRSK